ncbi:MAG: 2-hydroxychromene-2-carboxylate isomerase [Myxococcota bacterium]
MGTPITFVFDFISPFAYLAWKQAPALAKRRRLELHPVLFAGMLNHFGHLGPAEIPPKRIYIFKQCIRLAASAGVPLEPPPAHPFNPLTALRIIAALDDDYDTQLAATNALFDTTWAGGAGIATDEDVVRALQQRGLNGENLVERSREPQNKERLKRLTAQAIERGAFGVPSFIVDGELFWGHDSMEHIDAYLRGEDPVQAADLKRWRDLPAAAHRR